MPGSEVSELLVSELLMSGTESSNCIHLVTDLLHFPCYDMLECVKYRLLFF